MKPVIQTLLIIGIASLLLLLPISLIASGFLAYLAFFSLFAVTFYIVIASSSSKPPEKPIQKPKEPPNLPDTIYELNRSISSENSLPNGMFFNEVLSKSIYHAERRQQLLAVMLIDINQHDSKLTMEMGKKIIQALRKEDILAKLDGSTFIVLLEDIKKTKFAGMVAEKLLKIIPDKMTACIGISIYPYDANSLEALIDKAYMALFKAQHEGSGNQYQFASKEMHIEALEYIQLDSALRKAMHNNELALYYQPLYRIKTGTISGAEALMRWEHPAIGIVEPAKFIQLAEESGMIIEMSEWALREAAKQILHWQQEGYTQLTVALKLSPKQFHHPELAQRIAKALKGIAIDPGFIELEITEKTLMEDVKKSTEILNNLTETGVHISIDHFGTGYTSIQYLKAFPVSSIKIDKSYIKGLPNHPDDIAITNAIIALAHHLGLEVVAEGVETADQIQHLLQQNCDIVQGYYLGHPLTAEKMTLQLRKIREEVIV